VIRELDFEIENEGFTGVRATRGSQLGGATLSPDRVPLSLQVSFEPAGTGTRVVAALEDRWKVSVGRQAAASAAYERAFTDVLGALDAALGRLDPAALFAGWTGSVGDSSSSAAVVQRAGRWEKSFMRRSARLLDGKAAPGPGQLGRGEAGGAAGGEIQVAIAAPDKVARMDLAAAYVLLTAGRLIAARPGQLPPPMAAQALVILLEQRLDTSTVPQAFVQIQIPPEHVPVLTFLRQQARLRDELPLRTLQVCTTCKLEKVVNPDFLQMRERSRRMKVLSGSFGAVIGAHHVSPYVLIGRLVQLKKSDPDFVCQRCQGLDAEETIITFCPKCGDRRSESVLRECPRCKLDYRTLVTPETLWQDVALPSYAAPTPVTGAVAGGGAPVAAAAEATAVNPPAGWFADYSGRHEHRYWDGQAWTTHVSDAGVPTTDAL
jgi:hypothetical protein